MAKVARATSIPIATGERLTTKYEFARILATGAANILQMNLGRVGGILEAKKVAALAEVHYAQIAPHLYCGPVVGAANIQIATCTPNFLILESIQQWGGFHAQILKKPIRWEEGYVIPPTAPGLGVELDEAVALAHPFTGSALHLEMAVASVGLNSLGASMRYGFVGLGHLGKHLAANLARAGFALAVHDLHPGSAELVLAAGARWSPSVRELAAGCDCLITCLPSPAATRAVLG